MHDKGAATWTSAIICITWRMKSIGENELSMYHYKSEIHDTQPPPPTLQGLK